MRRQSQVAALVLCAVLAGCEYAGHAVKASVGRQIGETVKGTAYTVGCEVQFRRAP